MCGGEDKRVRRGHRANRDHEQRKKSLSIPGHLYKCHQRISPSVVVVRCAPRSICSAETQLMIGGALRPDEKLNSVLVYRRGTGHDEYGRDSRASIPTHGTNRKMTANQPITAVMLYGDPKPFQFLENTEHHQRSEIRERGCESATGPSAPLESNVALPLTKDTDSLLSKEIRRLGLSI